MTTKLKRPFVQEAARASWLLPLVATLFMGLLNGVVLSGQTSSPLAGLIVGGLFLLSLVAGVVFGIIGCTGLKRYGAKSTLVPGTIGILLNGGILLLMIVLATDAYHAARRAAQLKREQVRMTTLESIVENVNSQLPIMADEATRLHRVTIESPKLVDYHHTILEVNAADVDQDFFQKTMRPAILDSYRNDPAMEWYRDNQVSVRISYADENGNPITSITVP